jgi:hypothetical protein
VPTWNHKHDLCIHFHSTTNQQNTPQSAINQVIPDITFWFSFLVLFALYLQQFGTSTCHFAWYLLHFACSLCILHGICFILILQSFMSVSWGFFRLSCKVSSGFHLGHLGFPLGVSLRFHLKFHLGFL